MPCNCDHLHPTRAEKHRQEAATNLIYLKKRLGQRIPVALKDASCDIYGTTDEWVEALCSTLSNLYDNDCEKFKEIVWDGSKREARALAEWWEEHMEVDRQRRQKESALAKLTDEEKKLLGLDTE